MASAIEGLFVQLRRFFEPLNVALVSPQEFAAFLRRFGFSFDSGNVGAVVGNLAPLRTGVLQLGSTTTTALANGLDAADLITIGTAAAPLFKGISDFRSSISALPAPPGMSAATFGTAIGSVGEELFDLLLTDYLSANAPLTLHVLAFLDIAYAEEIPATGDPRSRGLSYVRSGYRWDRIGLLFDDAEEWAGQAYGWGTDFRSDLFIRRLSRVLEYVGGMADIRDMSQAQAAVFMPQVADSPIRPNIALAPIHRSFTTVEAPTGDVSTAAEIGLALFPVAGTTGPADNGIAIGPYTEGTLQADIPIGDRLALKLTGALGALGGVVFSFRPSGATHDIGVDAAAFTGDFTAELTLGPEAPQGKIVLIGDAASTRVEIDAVTASVGGTASNSGAEFFAAAGIKKLHIVVDASDDGLLATILSTPIDVEIDALGVGWRSGRGVYFEGGTGITVTIPVDRQIGPFHLYDITIALDWKDALTATGVVTADATLGPLYAYVEGLGLTTTLVPKPGNDGALGRFDIRFGLKLPTGYAVAFDAPPISGGGYLSVRDNEYRGALALRFETFGISAFAILNTKLPENQPGFSFVASIFGDFVIPLGFGFFLTGVGGLIAVHRTVDTEALREVLYRGEMDSILFPADPIANAPTILENMAQIFPIRKGQYAFGPMARIAFNQPALIQGKLGVVLEVGDEVRLLVLGALGSKLPTAEAPLVVLEVMFFGEIDFGAGTISFDASLQNSRVLAWSVSGDMAARTGWASGIDHVISFGGLHPRYPRPANLPELRRMSISFGTNNPRVSLWSYAAITLNTLQFGAGGDLYAKGPKVPFVGRLAAEGHAYFDALVYFDPFAFMANLGGSLTLLVDGDSVLNLGFDIKLSGPNEFVIDGKVWATVCGVDVDFSIHHRWGDRRDLPDTVADPVAILRDAIAAAPTLEPIRATALSDGVRFASPPPGDTSPRPTSPVGGLRFHQRAMPLAIAIEKIGEANIPQSPRTFDFAVYAGQSAITTKPAEVDFVHGHFWRVSEAERLRGPTFERHKSGFEIASSDDITVDFAKAIDVEYGYEYVPITDDASAALAALPFAVVTDALFAHWMDAHHRESTAPLDRAALVGAAADAPTLAKPAFTPADAGVPMSLPFAVAKEMARERPQSRRNPVLLDYLATRG